MSIFYERLHGTARNGRVGLIPLKEKFSELHASLSASKDILDWEALNIDESKLASFYAKVSPVIINEYLAANSNLVFLRDLKKCAYVEDDGLFKWNHKYNTLFAALCASLQRFPTVHEFWKFWEQKNYKALAENLNEQLSYSAISKMAFDTGLAIPKCRQLIMQGAEYRAKRFACAAVREMDTMLMLAQSLPEEFEGYEVYAHPLIDCICKYDAIILCPNQEVVALAICLSSRQSSQAADRKSDNIPIYFKELVNRAVGVEISMKSHCNGIYIASPQEKADLRGAVAGDPFKIRLMNRKYTWANAVSA